MLTEQRRRLPVDYLYRGLHLDPRAIAAEDSQEAISYQVLIERVEALACGLQQQIAVGSRVALCAQNHIDHLTAYLALIVGGFIWVPINPKNGQQLNTRLIAKSEPALIMVDEASKHSIENICLENTCIENICIENTRVSVISLDGNSQQGCRDLIRQYQGRPFVPERPAADAVMGIKFTGGTTGEPKGVMQTHANVAAVIENMQARFGFKQSDCNLAVAPLTHGGSHYILPLLAVGGRHILLAQAQPDTILRAFRHQAASISFMPPTLIYKLLDLPDVSRKDFSHLRHLTYSAAPMPPQRIAQAIDILGPHLSTVYGQTEAPMTITAMSAEDMGKTALRPSVGKACRHSEITIIDADGNHLGPGQSGEVAVRGGIVMKGYYKDPDKTASSFSGDWLLTGDLGFINDSGYLFLQGRSKELIISGGFNVYPAEIENALMQLGGVRECAAFGVDDDYWGERIEAAVCLQASAKADQQRLRQQLKQQLGSVKTPKKIHFVEALPRNPVGKVVRREVKKMLYSTDQDYFQ